MTRKKIHVTAEDIANGEQKSCCQCPVALALSRETHNMLVSVAGPWWNAVGGGKRLLSRSAQRFIKRFDSEKSVEPFNFFTEVPDA